MPDRDELERLYEDHVLPSAETPAHRGYLPAPDAVGLARNPACGDQVRIEIRLDPDGRIGQVVHESRGCVVSRAAAELLCRHVEGLTPGQAE